MKRTYKYQGLYFTTAKPTIVSISPVMWDTELALRTAIEIQRRAYPRNLLPVLIGTVRHTYVNDEHVGMKIRSEGNSVFK